MQNSTALFPYGLMARLVRLTRWDLHSSRRTLGVFDGTLREYDYDDVQETRKIEVTSNGGWIGITDKYWLAALVPDRAKTLRIGSCTQ